MTHAERIAAELDAFDDFWDAQENDAHWSWRWLVKVQRFLAERAFINKLRLSVVQ